MSFLDNIIGAVTQPVQDLGTGIGALGQSMRPDRQAPRREKPGYRPIDQAKLDLLQKYAAMGLDPSFLQPFAAEVTGGLDQRLELWRQKNAMRREAMMNLPAMAGQAFEMSQAGMDPSAIGAAFQGVPGKAGNILENQVIGSFDQGPNAAIPPEEQVGIYDQATELATAGTSLHDARVQMMSRARALGADDAQLQATYDLIGNAFSGVPLSGYGTGMPGQKALAMNAPTSYAEYQAQQANEEATRPGRAAPRGGGGGGTLDALGIPAEELQTRQYPWYSLPGLYERGTENWLNSLPSWWPGSPNA